MRVIANPCVPLVPTGFRRSRQLRRQNNDLPVLFYLDPRHVDACRPRALDGSREVALAKIAGGAGHCQAALIFKRHPLTSLPKLPKGGDGILMASGSFGSYPCDVLSDFSALRFAA